VTDAGLANLSELTNLQTLCLLGTKVTDDGLVHLRGLKNLQFLYLSGTLVTDGRVRLLQADLPECQMDR
jgi:Leucine-rich repeat (LRR) protein